MGLKALKRMAPHWYVPKSERDEHDKPVENPTRFRIRGLNGEQQGYIHPELQIDQMTKTISGMSGKGIVLALSYGLLDWETFSDDDGPIAFSPLNFERIDLVTRYELAMQILASSFVSPEEKKT